MEDHQLVGDQDRAGCLVRAGLFTTDCVLPLLRILLYSRRGLVRFNVTLMLFGTHFLCLFYSSIICNEIVLH